MKTPKYAAISNQADFPVDLFLFPQPSVTGHQLLI